MSRQLGQISIGFAILSIWFGPGWNIVGLVTAYFGQKTEVTSPTAGWSISAMGLALNALLLLRIPIWWLA